MIKKILLIGAIPTIMMASNATCCGSSTPSSTPTSISEETDTTSSDTSVEDTYQIVYENIKRYDGGVSYYVLIDEVDLTNDEFKNEIRGIINNIVAKKARKISVDIIDNSSTLELYYKSHYGSNTLGRILTEEELNDLERHLIASFDGELETNCYNNSLIFFPSYQGGNELIEKYTGGTCGEEYNPE